MPRIVSFLPAGTEMVYALGAGAELVGRSHECDYPAFVLDLPVVSRPALDLDNASPAAIDSAVTQQLADGATLYTIDEKLLRSLEPEVILTQNLCRVCAPSGDELTRAVRKFDVMPEVLFLTPRTIGEISDNVRTVGDAIGRAGNARAIIADSESRLQRVKDAVRSGRKRRVVFLEWINPFFSAGHWVPEMISIAGGEDPLGRAGEDSVRIEWDDVVAAEPEAIVVSPCGYRLDRAAELARELPIIEGVEVYAVDANAYFARPGPRVAEGVELLAHLLHPDLVRWTMPDPAWERIR
ncbi:MAG TPA: cobalamin-binding protein [Gemmatimonadaceae bacterium]|jgi:iron complex transport system substrate-binding protein